MDRLIEKKKWTTKKIIRIVLISVFVLFILYLIFLKDKSSKLYIDRNRITIIKVKKDKFQEFIPVDGKVLPKSTVYIDAVQGGIVEKKYVDDGAILQKGDTIIKLFNANMELTYMDQETRMYDAINNLINTKISLEQNKFYRQKEITQLNYQIDKVRADFKRKTKLFDEKLISDKEYEDTKRDFDFALKQLKISLKLKQLDSLSSIKQTLQIDNSVSRMYNNLDLLKRNLNNLYIKSSVNGQLSSFKAEIGETKAAGEHLGQIDIKNGFKLRANIDERYISRVIIGQDAEFYFSGKNYNLKINKIYTDVTNGAFQVDLLFDNMAPKSIKRGQTIQLKLKFSSAEDATIIKRGGFFQETGGKWIYIIDESGKFAYKRDIKIGRQNTIYYEVLLGLNPGEKVIVSSYEAFGDKDKLIFR